MMVHMTETLQRLDQSKASAKQKLAIQRHPFDSLSRISPLDPLCAAEDLRVEDVQSDCRILDLVEVDCFPARNEVLVRVNLRAPTPGRVLLEFVYDGMSDLEAGERSLGIVLRFDSVGPPIWLEAN